MYVHGGSSKVMLFSVYTYVRTLDTVLVTVGVWLTWYVHSSEYSTCPALSPSST